VPWDATSPAAAATLADVARASSSRDPVALVEILDAIDAAPEQIAAALRRLRLGQLVLAALAQVPGGLEHDVAVAMVSAFEASGTAPFPDDRRIAATIAETLEALAAADVPALVLKGVVFGHELYGDVDRRPQQDVDLLVHPHDARRARRSLEKRGFAQVGRDAHAVTLERSGPGPQVDLHHRLRSTPGYAIDEERAWSTARELVVRGVTMRTLSHEVALTFVTTSLVEDVAFGMAKIRNVCDVWLLAGHLDARVDWDRWFAERATERLEGIVVNGAAVALAALDGSGDAPRLAEAIERRRPLVRVDDRAAALELVTAPRGSAANMAWMGEVYPASLLGFRLQAFLSGFPGTLRHLRPDVVSHQMAVRRARRVRR
jgi:hypothetical protein